MTRLYPISNFNQENQFGNTAVMEAALAHGQTDANFIQILKLAIHHETDFKVTNTFGKSKKVTIHFAFLSKK